MSTTSATQGHPLSLPRIFVVSRLDQMQMSYDTYRQTADAGNNLAIALQFSLDHDVTALNDALTPQPSPNPPLLAPDGVEDFQGRLVFEPYQTFGGAVTAGAWQSWNATAGKWWRTTNATVRATLPYPNDCVQASPCTIADILTKWPNAGVSAAFDAIVLKAGSGWGVSFTGNVDNLSITIGGQTTTFDFEPETPCTTTCYVDAATGNDSFGGDTPSSAKKTIQAAVNQVSVGGDVIVAAGTYVEDVNVTKSIDLLGAGLAQSVVSGPPGGDGATIRVAASGVIVDGFGITREGNAAASWNDATLNFAGVAVQGQANRFELRNSRLFGNRTGIDINNSNGNSIHHNLVEDNHTGMILRNQTDNTTVTNNFVRNNRTVGILFLDASGGTNAPVQQALGSTFSDNDISGNWYGQVVDRQAGGALPPPGTTNLKNFEGNWYGSASPVVSTVNSAEPGYSTHIPVAYGGTATPPGGQPDILGPASANIDHVPYLCTGTDASSDPGFQPAAGAVSPCDLTGPAASSIAPALVPVGVAFEITATISDAITGNSAIASAAYSIDGGSPVAMTAQDGTFDSPTEDVTKSVPAFTTTGVYQLCVRGSDVWGNVGAYNCQLLAVYDPSAGFVTGGGHITSPVGAFVADPSLTGRANFGFVSKYVKGKTAPSGNTEFQFQAAGFTFTSTDYEWLVVNQNASTAQFKGTGSWNGAPGFKFMVWAKDGTPDSFRIQISDGAGFTVYDNVPSGEFGTPLAGGNIIVHVPKK